MGNTMKYGLKIFFSIGALFLGMNLLGLGHVSELRAANIIFVVYFTYQLASANKVDDDNITYTSNLLSLFLANFIAVVLCIIGVIVFVNLLPSYLEVISVGAIWANTESLMQLVVALFFEGMAGSAIVSFSLMQYWKNVKRKRTTLP